MDEGGTRRGRAHPLGVTILPGGANFSLFSESSDLVELLLFDDIEQRTPSRVVRFDPARDRTYYYWHRFVPEVSPGQLYAYRVFGPFDPAAGHRFDGEKVLLDPYAKGVAVPRSYEREAARATGDNCAHAMRGVVVDRRGYDWEGDTPLYRPLGKTIIYELHVGGFTRHESSGVAPEKRGTYAGLIEKIPYLKALGVTAVELLPVQQFDEQDAPKGLINYWGYSPVAFSAPHAAYSSRKDPLGPVMEFRAMVKALHRAGIEVILDVVFNHTSEGDELGPTLSLRGMENLTYYHLSPDDRGSYRDFSGCGNSLNANHSVVRRMIMDSLRYWVEEMHVDGFRFDLASVLARDEDGEPLKNPPILWSIESDPVLAGIKVIAEAWDAAGLYQVGSFIGHRWAEWNGRFRDTVRRFTRGDDGLTRDLATRIAGSPDLYLARQRPPQHSINFVTCHDGFTLNDLVSYEQKHNEANLEENRDGSNQSFSFNCGVEGPSDDPEVESLRERQIRNLFTLLLVSQGTPLLSMGDEVRRSQQGNNNAYCQDNALSWLDWSRVEEHAGLLRFVRGLVQLRRDVAILRAPRYLVPPRPGDRPQLTWHGIGVDEPDWAPHSHSLAATLSDPVAGEHVHLIFNSWREPLTFALPHPPAGTRWHRIVDTGRASPQDFRPPGEAPAIDVRSIRAEGCTALVLMTE